MSQPPKTTQEYQGYYDNKWSKSWGDMQEYGPMHRHLRRQIMRRVRQFSFESILDAGCGNGLMLAHFRHLYGNQMRLVGTDVSEEALAQARKHVDAEFISMDLQRSHLPEVFDLVICSETLEHIEDDQSAANNLYQMARHLIVSVPGNTFKREDTLAGHYRRYTTESLAELLSNAGFQVLEASEWGFPFFSPLYRLLMDVAPHEARTGNQLTWQQRVIGEILHAIFFLNVVKKGDQLFAVAQRPIVKNG